MTMRKTRYLLLLVIVMACAGGEYEEVTIVHIHHSDEIGAADYWTIVEFSDKTRRKRAGVWGQVGETFLARKDNSSWGWGS